MHISTYDYDYPESAIAMQPPEVRGKTKLFVVYTQTGEIEVSTYDRLAEYLSAEDLLVRNITKVFHARMYGAPVMSSGEVLAETEVFITEPHAQSLEEYAKRQYDATMKGFRLTFLCPLRKQKLAKIERITLGEGFELIAINFDGKDHSGVLRHADHDITVEELFSLFERKGKVPLPPYIKRETTAADDVRYQTIFAKNNGSVAAPTASLNFTKELEHDLRTQGTQIAEVTLHVGRGTFLPLRNEIIEENVLHHEPFYVSAENLAMLHRAERECRRIVAMGTTVVRTLETVAEAIKAGQSDEILSETNLFLYPPHSFAVVGAILTNFHFPKSSLITLVDAFLQDKQSKLTWREIYEFGIKNDAKLFSYGDSMLLL